LRATLVALNVDHSIITDNVIPRNGMDRIDFLERLRNLSLEPLTSKKGPLRGKSPSWSADTTLIIYLNDIYYSANQIWELIETNEGNYDMACAMDFYYRFYDIWVARDLWGTPLSGQHPYFHDWDSVTRMRHGEPIRVFSCWNGVVVMRAEPFLTQNVTFRSSAPHEIYHSECTWLCYDFWRTGFTRILINPKIRVAYHRRFYMVQNYINPWLVHPFQYLAAWWRWALGVEYKEVMSPQSQLVDQHRNIPDVAKDWKTYMDRPWIQ
jgi:hypothetical protein